MEGPTQIWARSVQTLGRLLDTNKQTPKPTNKQTDNPNLYIEDIDTSLGTSVAQGTRSYFPSFPALSLKLRFSSFSL